MVHMRLILAYVSCFFIRFDDYGFDRLCFFDSIDLNHQTFLAFFLSFLVFF